MRLALKLPSTQVLVHILAVFLLAFGGQLAAAGTTNESNWLALLTSGFAAGLVAVAHILGSIFPLPDGSAVGVSFAVKSNLYNFVMVAVMTFVSIFGTALVTGATKLTSFPSVVALLIAAISAAVAGVVQLVLNLIPAPKPEPV